MLDFGNGSDQVTVTITSDVDISAQTERMTGVWHVEVIDDDKGLIWDETFQNLLTTQGKNDVLTVYTGGTFSTLYASAFTGGSPTLTATYAAPVVTEVTSGTIANRVALSWAAAAAGAIVGTCSIPVLAATTLTGIMAMHGGAGIATVGNTTAVGGVLLSEGTLGTPQVISTTGTLNLSYTLSI